MTELHVDSKKRPSNYEVTATKHGITEPVKGLDVFRRLTPDNQAFVLRFIKLLPNLEFRAAYLAAKGPESEALDTNDLEQLMNAWESRDDIAGKEG